LSVSTRRAIVLDDDGSVRRLLTRIIGAAGYTVLPYSSPTETTVFAHPENCPCATGHPERFMESPTCADLIVTDIGMPGIGGIEYVRAVRKVGCGVRHIAVLSGKCDRALERQAEELGFKLFQKPYGMVELRAWLQSLEY